MRKISIHAHSTLIREGKASMSISIHAPRMGSAPCISIMARSGSSYFYPRSPRGERQQKQREKSLLLFHYKTLCTNLEDLLSEKKQKLENLCKAGLRSRCEGAGETMRAYPSHGFAGGVRRAGGRPAQRAGGRRRVPLCFCSCCPAGRTAGCPDRGR